MNIFMCFFIFTQFFFGQSFASERIQDVPEIDLVRISPPKNGFYVGSNSREVGRRENEDLTHVVLTYDYDMMTTEVTQGLYFQIMGENPSQFRIKQACPETYERRQSPHTGYLVELCPYHPVEHVDHKDFQEFISKLNRQTGETYRLPTEAEWEYAARGGTATAYFFGDNPRELDEYAIYTNNSEGQTQAVGPHRDFANKPNQFGLYDMYGNVEERVAGAYTQFIIGGENPGPRAFEQHRQKTCRFPCGSIDLDGRYVMLRGGNIFSADDQLRSARRSFYVRPVQALTTGYRLVKTVFESN